jgi:hypothetical protein
VTQVIVGTGGRSVYATPSVVPNSAVRSSAGFGWLRLTLHRTSADLRFVPVAGSIFTDEETITCRS